MSNMFHLYSFDWGLYLSLVLLSFFNGVDTLPGLALKEVT